MLKAATVVALIACANASGKVTEYEIGSSDFPEHLGFMLDSDAFTDRQNILGRVKEWSSSNSAGLEVGN